MVFVRGEASAWAGSSEDRAKEAYGELEELAKAGAIKFDELDSGAAASSRSVWAPRERGQLPAGGRAR